MHKRHLLSYFIVALTMLGTLTACGFHLRGSIPLPDSLKVLHVNVPTGTFKDQLENALSKALGKYSNLSKTIVETRDHDCIVKLKFLEKVMGFKLFFTAPITDENIDKTGLYVSGFVVNYLDETSATIQKAKDAGFEIALYGVKIRQDISPAIKFEPDYIQTDNIPLTLSYLGR